MTRTRDNAAAGVDVDAINTALDGADFSDGVAGDILTHDGTSYGRLAKGTAYQSLRMNSGATAPEYGEPPLGVGQTWASYTGSRARSTNYQNTTGRSIMVSILDIQTSQTAVKVSSDASTWITVGITGQTGVAILTSAFIVPDNWYYKIDGGSGAVTGWAELR